MTQVNFDAQIKTLDGKPMPSRQPIADPRTGRPAETLEDVPPLTLRQVCQTALITAQDGDAQTPGLAYSCYQLAQKLQPGGLVEIDAAEMHLVKGRIEKFWGPLVIGQSWDLLEAGVAPAFDDALDARA